MPRLSMTAFVTLDGVMQAPGGRQEDTWGGFTHGGWLVPYFDEAEFGPFVADVFSRAGAFLLGRGTYQIFAGWWPRVTDPNDPVAAALNGLPKHVASRTLARADWSGSTVVRDVASALPRIEVPAGKEVQVHGSPGLGRWLLEQGLVDELHLVVAPVILGTGKRLFGPGLSPAAFTLAARRVNAKGLTLSTYRKAGAPAHGDVGEAPG